jgi:toxin-antitoxin system PIN domain toxin
VILPDVIVLMYAFRSDSADHGRYRAWLDDMVNGREAYGMSPQVLASLVRISTHPRVYARPNRAEEALAFCDALARPPNCHIVQPGARHWTIFEDLCRQAKANGNLVQDAWFAALAI